MLTIIIYQLRNILLIIYLIIISYIINLFNNIILLYISEYIYVNILTSLLIITIIDGLYLLDEKNKYHLEYKNTHRLLELQIIENNKLEQAIKAFKKT
jgi:hypothetical protein